MFMPHPMHKMRTIATDDPAAWAFVSHFVCLSNSFARCRRFDAAITTVLEPLEKKLKTSNTITMTKKSRFRLPNFIPKARRKQAPQHSAAKP